MQTRRVDVAVIGAGTAGLNARRQAERRGASTILIESGPYGTMCARVGCMPSKLLIAAADVAHEAQHAERFGIRVRDGVEIDGPAVMGRVRRERDRFVGFVVEDTEALAPELRLRGHARFLTPGVLQVEDHTRVEFGAVVLAVGSSPVVPSVLDPVRERVLLNDDVFELKDLPQSVAVLGAGVIGLELGQALARLGVRTRLFVRSRKIGTLTDPAVRTAAHEIFGQQLDLRWQTRIEEASRTSAGVRLRWRDETGQTAADEFDFVLAATGREPNLAGLDLEKAGVPVGAGGVPPFDERTGRVPGTKVFLAGDATGERTLLHEAADEGRIAGFNAARPDEMRAHRRRVPLSVVFSSPQIALVGERYADLDPDQIEVGSVDYGDQGRARVMGQTGGLVRVYADRKDGRLLGAEMLGPRVEHTAHLLAWVVQQGLAVDRILELPFYHPVIEEGIRTALRDVARRLDLADPPCARELDCGPGA